MTTSKQIGMRVLLAPLACMLITAWIPADAGLLGGGSRPRGSSSGLLSPAQFNCVYDDGYTVEINTDTLQEAQSSAPGMLLDPEIRGVRAVIKGEATCTTTSRPPASDITAKGKCSFVFEYKLPNEEPDCEIFKEVNSSKTYALQCNKVNLSTDVTGTISCEVGQGPDKFELVDPDHPCQDLEDGKLCGINVGITPDDYNPIANGSTDCEGVFGNNPLFEVTQYFVKSQNCGFDIGKGSIDFEVTPNGNDQQPLLDPISPVGNTTISASLECFEPGNPGPVDQKCYYMGYGPPTSGFLGDSFQGCGNADTPETMESCANGVGNAGKSLGSMGITDTDSGPGRVGVGDTDNLYVTFTEQVANPSIAIIDYRSDGGGASGDEVTLSYFSDDNFENSLGTWRYRIPCNNCDPNGRVVTLGPSANDADPVSYTGIGSASVTFSGDKDVGVAWDNLMYYEVETELGPLVNRFCTAGNRDEPGIEAENFVPLDGSSIYDPDFNPMRDCSGTESEGEAQFVSENAAPLDSVDCSNKTLTVGACEGGSSGNKQIKFSIGGNDVGQFDPAGVFIEDSPATCSEKKGTLNCKAACTAEVYNAVKDEGEATVFASLRQFGTYTSGACEMRAN